MHGVAPKTVLQRTIAPMDAERVVCCLPHGFGVTISPMLSYQRSCPARRSNPKAMPHSSEHSPHTPPPPSSRARIRLKCPQKETPRLLISHYQLH